MSDILPSPDRRPPARLGSGRVEVAMSVEVKCGCGQVVSADDAHRGQVVQCPYCQAGVSVPVAAAARPTQTAADRQAAATGELVLGLILAVIGFFLWDTPLGKLMAFGGLATAADASRRF